MFFQTGQILAGEIGVFFERRHWPARRHGDHDEDDDANDDQQRNRLQQTANDVGSNAAPPSGKTDRLGPIGPSRQKVTLFDVPFLGVPRHTVLEDVHDKATDVVARQVNLAAIVEVDVGQLCRDLFTGSLIVGRAFIQV